MSADVDEQRVKEGLSRLCALSLPPSFPYGLQGRVCVPGDGVRRQHLYPLRALRAAVRRRGQAAARVHERDPGARPRPVARGRRLHRRLPPL